MADVSLRAYLKEIDELIEREQLDEAIAHSRHILETYPKHLDTYRLLGKAYLEAKRYGDAADIFQRVLSAVPDDFVSQVGMSIVREDEGNIDAAIWHMERAFETSPANPAIQQELRRLIGRRDGIEPHKVRLTRGALARMYAQGELYPQAAAELRAALQEDQNRPDLQVALAEMHWKVGQRAEAVELCTRILDKLPYCREANRILASAYQSAGKSPEATPYHRRLAMLDPYAAFIENAMVDPRAVDAGSVHIERLEWYPGLAVPAAQPDWATTIGSEPKPQQQVASAMPGWLESLEAERSAIAAPAAPAVAPKPAQPPPPVPAASEPPTAPFAAGVGPQNIPDWMRQAGWQESTGTAKEGPLAFSDSELAGLEAGIPPEPPAADETGLAPAEIPDWVQAIAPRDAPSPAGPPPASAGESAAPLDEGPVPGWLEEASAAAPAVSPEPVPGTAEPSLGMFPADASQMPGWLDKPADGATETIVTWLGDRRPPELRRAPAEPPAEPVPPAEPAWPSEPEAEVEPPSVEGAEQPAWLSAMSAAADETPPEPEQAPDHAPPAWLSGITEAAAQQEPLSAEDLDFLRQRPQPEEAPATPDEAWLARLESAPEDEAPAERQAPDWLRGAAAPEPSEPPAPQADWLSGVSEAAVPPVPEPPRTPDWMQGVAAPPLAPAAAADESLDWLRGIAEPEKPEPAPVGPDWLQGIAEPEKPAAESEAVEEADWLKGLAEPSVAAEPEQETPAEWLREPKAPDLAPEPAPAAPRGEPETPAWLQEFAAAGTGAPPPPSSPEEQEPEFEGALDWLREPAQSVAPEPTAGRTLPPVAEPASTSPADAVGEDEALQWLEGLAARQAPPEPADAGLPPFMAAKPTPAPPSEFPPRELPPEEPEEGLEWLEKLAAEPGLDADLAPAAPPIPSPAPPPPVTATPLPPAAAPVPTRRTGSLAPKETAPPPAAPPAAPSEPIQVPAPEEPEAAPDWLRAAQEALRPGDEPLAWKPIDTTPVPAAKPVPIEAADEPTDEVPDWLKAIAADTAGEPEPSLEVPAPPPPEPPPAPVAIPAEPVEEELAWLQEPAADLGTAELEELPLEETELAAPPEETPVWFAGEAEAPELEIPLVEPEEAEEAEAVPDWLQAGAPLDLAEAVETPPAEEVPAPAEEPIPDWLWTSGEPEPTAPVREPEAELPEPAPAAVESPAAGLAAPAIEWEPEPEVVVPLAPAPTPREPAKPPARPSAPRPKAGPAPSEVLAKARRALAAGDLENALVQYGGLIRKRRELEAVIEDLRAVLLRSPNEAAVWQALGDAFMKGDRLPEALEAYKHGLEAT